MSTTTSAPETPQAQPAGPVVRVTVPERTVRSELRAIKVVWQRELVRFANNRLRIVTSLVQPLLFLFVLGSGLQRLASAGPMASA